MPTTTGSPAPGSRQPSAARRAANAGAAAAGNPPPAAPVTPGTPPAGTGTPPAAGTTTSPPRRNTLGIILAVLGGLAALMVFGYFLRPSVNVTVKDGGSRVIVVNPGSPNSGPPASPSASPKPTATPSASTSPSPTPSAAESKYSHWISPADVTTACHEQASPASSAVFQPELYNAKPVSEDWYCQDVQGETQTSWYSASTSQPLGPVISYSVNLDQYCQYTYGQAGSSQWKAEAGPNNKYLNSPPAPGPNPMPHEMCYEVP